MKWIAEFYCDYLRKKNRPIPEYTCIEEAVIQCLNIKPPILPYKYLVNNRGSKQEKTLEIQMHNFGYP